MKQDIKERWLAALESGEYKKGKNYMRAQIGQEYTYCCLGVLTDLYCKETGDEFYTLFARREDGDDPLRTSILPYEVRQWADLHSIDLMKELAADNDTRTDGQFPIHMIKGI